MIKQLPEWYRIASLESLSEDILKKRSIVIDLIIKDKKNDWFFDCIRLYLNKPIINQEFKKDFIDLFFKEDALFRQRDNDLELRILAGAVINEYIINYAYDNCITIALSLISGSFANNDIINQDIINNVLDYLNKKSIVLREHSVLEYSEEYEIDETITATTIETLNEKVDDKFENYYNISQINELFNSLEIKIKKLEEESNIHWWIFRGYSNLTNKPIKELDYHTAPMYLGIELSDLTTIIPGPLSSKQFLKKILLDHFPDKTEVVILKDVINKVEKSILDNIILKYKKTSLENLCPITLGYLKAIEAGDNKSWITFFEKSSGIKSNIKVDLLKLSYQCYLENLLIKSLV